MKHIKTIVVSVALLFIVLSDQNLLGMTMSLLIETELSDIEPDGDFLTPAGQKLPADSFDFDELCRLKCNVMAAYHKGLSLASNASHDLLKQQELLAHGGIEMCTMSAADFEKEIDGLTEQLSAMARALLAMNDFIIKQNNVFYSETASALKWLEEKKGKCEELKSLQGLIASRVSEFGSAIEQALKDAYDSLQARIVSQKKNTRAPKKPPVCCGQRGSVGERLKRLQKARLARRPKTVEPITSDSENSESDDEAQSDGVRTGSSRSVSIDEIPAGFTPVGSDVLGFLESSGTEFSPIKSVQLVSPEESREAALLQQEASIAKVLSLLQWIDKAGLPADASLLQRRALWDSLGDEEPSIKKLALIEQSLEHVSEGAGQKAEEEAARRKEQTAQICRSKLATLGEMRVVRTILCESVAECHSSLESARDRLFGIIGWRQAKIAGLMGYADAINALTDLGWQEVLALATKREPGGTGYSLNLAIFSSQFFKQRLMHFDATQHTNGAFTKLIKRVMDARAKLE